MVLMLCFTACDDDDEPKKPEPEPDPNEVAAPDFGERERSKIEAMQNGTFLEVFEYKGYYKHTDKTHGHMGVVTQEDKWYFYPADQREADKKRGYAHDGRLYNEYWQYVNLDFTEYRELQMAWEGLCKKKYNGVVRPQYVYTGFDIRYYPRPIYQYEKEVNIVAFNNSEFVLKSNFENYQEYYAYTFTGKKYDDANSLFYGSVYNGAEQMLREMYEYYGSIHADIFDGNIMDPDKNGNPIPGTIGYLADQLGITL